MLKLKRFFAALIALSFLATPVVANEGEDVVIPHIVVNCLVLRDSGDKCSFTGGIMWWYLDCQNILVDPGPACGS